MIQSQQGRRRCAAVVLASFAVAVVLAACSSGGSSGGGSAAGTPVQGGTLVFARHADIFSFDPYNTQDDESIFTEMQVYDRLVALSPNGKSVSVRKVILGAEPYDSFKQTLDELLSSRAK